MIVPHGMENQAGFPFPGPAFYIRFSHRFHHRFFDHRHHPLVPGTFADPLQFLIPAELIGPFPFRQIFAHPGELFQPVFPEKKPVYFFGMVLPQGGSGVKTADRQFIGKFVPHFFQYMLFPPLKTALCLMDVSPGRHDFCLKFMMLRLAPLGEKGSDTVGGEKGA
jgi:hypothetical protein